ncbi:hypothetical protein BDQ17DRAFT_1427358 [Cyathus striatus]|nr:hypothetical protein BDQ17DRAFT_1427358 [Cyathus striatus]
MSYSQTPPPPPPPQLHPSAPLLDLSPAPPPLQSLRTPILVELREGGLQVPGEKNRKSLFLPQNPNVPKVPNASSPGPCISLLNNNSSNKHTCLEAPPLPPPSPTPLRSTSVPGDIYTSRVVDAQKPSPERQGSLDTQRSSTGALPRVNFYPKASGATSRPRSFSGWTALSIHDVVSSLCPAKFSHHGIPTGGRVQTSPPPSLPSRRASPPPPLNLVHFPQTPLLGLFIA